MDNDAAKEIFDELFSHLERLETQSEALLQFMKEKKRVTGKQLGPYLEKAGNASNVRWRAARVRIERLLSPTGKESAEARRKDETQSVKAGDRPSQHAETQTPAASREQEARPASGEAKAAETRETPPPEQHQPAPAAEAKSAEPSGPHPATQEAPSGKPDTDDHRAASAENRPAAAQTGKQDLPQGEHTSAVDKEAA